MSSRTIEFLYQSIADSQAIIRATDVKLGFLFAVNLLPITRLGDIYNTTKELVAYSPCFILGVVIVAILWFLSLYTLFFGLLAISNPVSVVPGDTPDGSFYSGGLFKFRFIDRLFNRSLTSTKTVDELVQTLPDEDNAIVAELVYEKVKLAYIRDMKIQRASLCIVFVFWWVILGVLMWCFRLSVAPSGC